MFIEPTTAAAAKSIMLRANQTVQVRGDLSTDIIAIKIPDASSGWSALVEDDTTITLTATNKQLTALGNTLIQIDKPTTTNAVGVAIL